MADDVDRAQERTETLRREALERTLAVAAAGAPTGDGVCADCGEDIPPARLAVLNGRALRCVYCEGAHESGRRYLDV